MFFGTLPGWIEAIQAWAASEPRITHVWVFGSRATGHRTPKENPDPEPDMDLGFLIAESARADDGEPDVYLISRKGAWLARLAAAIPVKVDLQHAEPATDQRVWPAIEREGVLIYERGAPRWTRKPERQ